MTGPVYYSIWLFCGTLYPAYESFKAVKSKNAKNYVSRYNVLPLVDTYLQSTIDSILPVDKVSDNVYYIQVRWMMYWIVYAIFAAVESILDPLLYFW